MSVGHQKTVSTGRLRLGLEPDMAERAGSDSIDYVEETRAAMYEYVFRRAVEDSGLSAQQAQTFQNADEQVGGRGGANQAGVVGRRLAEMGDEIDAQYSEEMEELAQMTGAPESAFSMFCDVVKHLFEWDESGHAKITIGRLAALMSYCYHLAKMHLQQNMTIYGILSFLGLLASWLFKFLLKAKFYEWLEKQGGWGQLLAMTTAGWGQHVFLVIGLASLAVWAYSYLKSK